MGLENFEPETFGVKFKNKSGEYEIVVRGLNLMDLSALVGDHIADIEAAVVLWKSAQERFGNTGNMDDVFLRICTDAPALVAEVISRSADDRDNEAKYLQIPFSVSVVALENIFRLTLVEQGGLKNLLTSLQHLVRVALPDLKRAGAAAA